MRFLIYIYFVLIVGSDLYALPPDKQTINIGVLSFRPVDENQKIWLPLGDQLHKHAPQFDFNITSYPQNEIVEKILKGKLDFAIVHPAIYVELEVKDGVTNIASLVRPSKDGSYHLRSYGGVVVTLASNKDIKTLQDIKGKTIATTHKDAFALMLMERELFDSVGIDITKDCKMLYTGQPMDNVLEKLRKHQADVGFFRTGYIEEMISKGKLKPDELRIINKVDDDYPYAHSTKLYPEWAVVATTRPDIDTVKAVIAALYQVCADDSPGYHEFSIPLSYKETRELMHEYSIDPFKHRQIAIAEVLNTYSFEIILILVFFVLFGLLMALIYRYQLLQIRKQSEQIRTILSNASDGVHVQDLKGKLVLFSDSFANMLGYTRKEASKLYVTDWDKNFDPKQIDAIVQKIIQKPTVFETKHTKKDGSVIDVEISAKSIEIDGKIYIYASTRDITQRKKDEIESLKHKIIFDSIAEGVYAVDTEDRCTYINNAAMELLQLSEEDIIGKNPHNVFHSAHQENVCPIQRAVLSGALRNIEEEFVRKDGTVFSVFITVSPIVKDGISIGSVITFSDITKEKEDQKRLLIEKDRFEYLAHHDILTDLPNRLGLIEYMELQCSQENLFAFMFLDLDGFKEINDSYGHQFGDKLLIEVAILLKKVFPSDAYIARMGGDEFAIVKECQDHMEMLKPHLRKLIDIFSYPFRVDNIDVYITTSIGIAIYPDDAITAQELMQKADAAMYKAKNMGRNTFSFYELSLTQKALHKTTVATKLRKALSNGELTMFIQPQVDPYDKKIIGAEVLIRWFSEDGTISPDIFIPIAEEMGLILEIGEFVLKESFTIAKRLNNEGLFKGRIAVNVSALQLAHPNFLVILEETMKETECSPSLIELEITESSILENPDKMILLLKKLKERGFHISIDDFGTGYSSMSYLKNLPIDKLKIDQSFIRDVMHEPKNQTIVKTIIALAKGLDMDVLAEGVETEEELVFLQENKIDYIQGYYYYKPMSFYDFKELLQ